jgi:hypothetical protein
MQGNFSDDWMGGARKRDPSNELRVERYGHAARWNWRAIRIQRGKLLFGRFGRGRAGRTDESPGNNAVIAPGGSYRDHCRIELDCVAHRLRLVQIFTATI